MSSPGVRGKPRNMNCSELLFTVQQAESSLPASSVSFFGHPPPPTMYAAKVLGTRNDNGDEVFALMAHTGRCVCVQLWICPVDSEDEQSNPTQVMEVLRLEKPVHGRHDDRQEEEIKCATLLTLDANFVEEEDRIPCLTPFSVVVGTSHSRVLSIELVMESWTTGQRTIRLFNDARPVFEPLPMERESPIKSREQPIATTSDPSDNDKSFSEYSVASENEQTSKAEEKPDAAAQEANSSKKVDPSSERYYPFLPQGGVASLNPFRSMLKKGGALTFVWISYRDGTMVRIHHAGFFASVVVDKSTDLGQDAIVRTRVLLPPSLEAAGATVLPLPKYHPSPLSPIPAADMAHLSLDDNSEVSSKGSRSEEDEDDLAVVTEIHEALSYGADTAAAGLGQEDLPALAFHTSENHFDRDFSGGADKGLAESSKDNEIFDAIKDNVIGGTKKLVRGVFGTAIGAVKWGLGSGGGALNDKDDIDKSLHDSPSEEHDKVEEFDAHPILVTFPGMHDMPTNLFTGFEMHDSPRQITSVSLDPDGNLVAASDNLGRVLLINLATKQVVRMWKGVREASCFWVQAPRRNAECSYRQKPILYIVIHSKQRKVVEVWRVRHGPRVKAIQVGRDAQIVQYREPAESGTLASCLLVHSTGTTQNQVELLSFLDEEESRTAPVAKPSSAPVSLSKSKHEAALRLQLLKQLLSDTNVPSNTQAVYEAFTSISSLTDLSTALDLLSVSTQLEKNMGVHGATFQETAVSYCSEKLDGIVKDGGENVYENPHVKEFLSKIKYHAQVIDAYKILRKFEAENFSDDEDDVNLVPRSAWAVEALAWVDTYERVKQKSIVMENEEENRERLLFASFAKACCASDMESVYANGIKRCRHHVRFTDSTRTRTEILIHVFQPLLQDVFAFKVVNSVFQSLGISTEYDYILKCFGEWFMTLPPRRSAQKSFFVWNSPMVRWLQGVVASQLDSNLDAESLLSSLHSFCTESESLVRAFLLSALCREAISVAARQREEKTYGKVSYAAAVHPWDSLLRKLRVCIFVSLRLHGVRLGAFPLSVANVEADDVFSVYEWVARDELLVSHKQEEIAMLEASCKKSSLIFHPSMEEGDDPKRVKRLQKACRTRVPSLGVQAGGAVISDRNDKPGALLLYLSSHNDPTHLVAHRALLLSSKWSQEPSSLQVLKDALSALQAFDSLKTNDSLLAAASIEVWQTHMRPVYRGFLFGFHDVPELSEHVISPLCSDQDWLRGLGQVAIAVLTIMSNLQCKDEPGLELSKGDGKEEAGVDTEDSVWPAVKEDFILKRLLEKSNRVEKSSLDSHLAVVCATLLSDDLPSLSQCVPDFYDCFLHTSLSCPPSTVALTNTDIQREFIERAIVAKAQRTLGGLGLIGPVLDNLQLGEIDVLATIWGIAEDDVRTTFLVSMYEVGKDAMVDDLITSHVHNINVDRFVDSGVDIACRRLDKTIAELRNSSEKRHVLALLDAETCQWLHERANESKSFLNQYASGQDVEVGNVVLPLTHTLILRLLSLCSASEDKETRIRIHSLSVLSGTLLKENV